MASSSKNMSLRQLQAMRFDKKRITIMHRPDATSSLDSMCLISSDYSESMARHFSTYCAAALRPESKPGTGVDLNRPSKPTVVVRGGSYATVCKVFKYINEYCGGKTSVPDHDAELPLLEYFGLLHHAAFLGVTVLDHNLDAKIAQVAKGHPNPQDVLAVLKTYPAGTYDHARLVVVESVADAIFRGAVPGKSNSLAAIRTQDPDFSTSLDALIEHKGIAQAEAKAAKTEADAKKKADKEAREKSEKEDKAKKNKVRRVADQAQRQRWKAERKAKQDEVAVERQSERIRQAAKAQRVDISKPASSYLRPRRGASDATVGKSGVIGSTQGEKGTASAPIPLEIVIGGRTIKIENAAEPLEKQSKPLDKSPGSTV